jgi:spore coat polysaccharide biosynthesis protein SpsF
MSYENEIDYSIHRWTLDTEKDFILIKNIYDNLYSDNKMFLFKDILEYIEKPQKFLELIHILNKKD